MEETSNAKKDLIDLDLHMTKEDCQVPANFLKLSKSKSVDYVYSQHDNRHAFQLHGVYFGQGLGKKLVLDRRNQHKSDDIISWSGRVANQLPHSSTYKKSYTNSEVKSCKPPAGSSPPKRQQPQHLVPLTDKPSGIVRPRSSGDMRRFPRTYTHPRSSDTLNTSGSWYTHGSHKSNPHQTSLSVLAATQQPFLSSNPWKYSLKQKRTLHTGRCVINQTC